MINQGNTNPKEDRIPILISDELQAKRWKMINRGNTNPKEDRIPILISDELDLGQKKYQKNRNIS